MREGGTIRHLEGKYRVVTARLVLSCTDAELRFYVFLKLHALEKNSAFPGERLITKALKWSRDKVFDTVDRMEKARRLSVIRVTGRPNVYDITWYDQENEKGFADQQLIEGSAKGISPKKAVPNQSEIPTGTSRKFRP